MSDDPPLLLDLATLVDPAHTAFVIIDMQNDFCAPGGWTDRIVKRDIEAALAGGVTAAPAPTVPTAAPTPSAAQATDGFEPAFDFEPATSMRKIIAQRLSESKQTVPHF